MSAETNSSIKWIMGLIGSAVVVFSGACYTQVLLKLNEHSEILAQRGERIAHLESQTNGTERRQNELKAALDKIEVKLDTLIDKVNNKKL